VRALVTGADGFIGRHIAAELRARRWDVSCIDVNPHPDGYAVDALSLFRTNPIRYDLVVHCAARSPHRAAIDAVPGLMAYNLQLDAAMFDWASAPRTRGCSEEPPHRCGQGWVGPAHAGMLRPPGHRRRAP